VVDAMDTLSRTSHYLGREHGRKPTPDELADKLELPLDKVRKALRVVKEPLSLAAPAGDDEGRTLGDLVEDTSVPSPVEVVMDANLAERTRNVLRTLTPGEETVLRKRFGIGEKKEHTLREIGQDFAVTHGGVPNKCGCKPTTCATVGAQCGTILDGCGGTVDCGGCDAGTCGGGGPNGCGTNPCVPGTCASLGFECGPISDGCGSVIQCGMCPQAGDLCIGGFCQ
jgi:hypothetical protein